MSYPFDQPDLFEKQCDYSRANRYSAVHSLATAISSKPYCSSNFSTGVQIRPKFTALERPHIQINTPWEVKYIVLDVDKPLYELSNWKIKPSLVVLNPENDHYHVYFQLETPVLMGEKANPHPQAYLKAVIKKMITAFDADPNYSGLIAKNPLHHRWQIAPYKGRTTYSLKRLEKAVSGYPQAVKTNLIDSVEGRNCTVFDTLRFWSYRQIQAFQSPLDWDIHVMDKCLSINQMLPIALEDREAFQIGKSVSKWTWRNRNKLNGSFTHRGVMGYGLTRHDTKEAPYLDKETIQAHRQAAAERTIDVLPQLKQGDSYGA
jgi:hypothetical protein